MKSNLAKTGNWFERARYGLFIHYGLYSLLGRGEWALNREQIPLDEYRRLAADFTAEAFDADAIAGLAVEAGMRYLVFTTMHHDGFRLYDSELADFNSRKAPLCKRDLVREIIDAARSHGLKVGLYHSLNNWSDKPDAVDALENKQAAEEFITATHERLKELARKYTPFDIMWYDGWWPFDAKGWQAEQMNEMITNLVPEVLFNGRNGLSGDFATPEGHVTGPTPWRPWEGCVITNDSWCWHAGDNNWKTPMDIIKLLVRCAQSRGNLLLNVGPKPDGSLPTPAVALLKTVGAWLKINGEAIYDTDFWTLDPHHRGDHRGDWCHFGLFTVKGSYLYLVATKWPGKRFSLAGLECDVHRLSRLDDPFRPIDFIQRDGRITIENNTHRPAHNLPAVFRFECDRPPVMYLTGGMRIPSVPHPHYDPKDSDILW